MIFIHKINSYLVIFFVFFRIIFFKLLMCWFFILVFPLFMVLKIVYFVFFDINGCDIFFPRTISLSAACVPSGLLQVSNGLMQNSFYFWGTVICQDRTVIYF